jgi:peroxiredoxin
VKKYRKPMQIAILLVFVLVGGITVASALSNDAEAPPTEGQIAPDFSVAGLDGQTYRLSDFRGRHVVLNFWGSFCDPCVREMPLLQQIYEHYADEGVVVLGVNLDESLATVRSFVRSVDVNFPILLDHGKIQKRYGVIYYPTTFVIGPDGKIAHKKVGEITDMRQVAAYF